MTNDKAQGLQSGPCVIYFLVLRKRKMKKEIYLRLTVLKIISIRLINVKHFSFHQREG